MAVPDPSVVVSPYKTYVGMANVSEVGFYCKLDMLDILDGAFLLSESH